jgi:ketosteroid isomerase-like protein
MPTTLEDRLAVTDVIIRYANSADARDMERFGTCFTEDVQVQGFSETPFSGRDAFVDLIRGAMQPFSRSQHLLGTHEVEIQGDTATLRTYFQVMSVPADDAKRRRLLWGIYADTLVRQQDQWRISVHRAELLASDPGIPS